MIIRRSWDFGEVHAEALSTSVEARRTAYILEPLKVLPAIEDLSEMINIVSIFGMDWERDLTPWPAPKAFKRGNDFSGGSDSFRAKLTEEIIPTIEKDLGIEKEVPRLLVGISLAGLFAIETAYKSDLFDTLCSISGSLWYDGFVEWMASQKLSPAVRRIYFSLGADEKNTRNQRMASVEERTHEALRIIKAQGAEAAFEENPGNHFSDGPLRVRKALLYALKEVH